MKRKKSHGSVKRIRANISTKSSARPSTKSSARPSTRPSNQSPSRAHVSRPIIKYVINAVAPKEVVLLKKEEQGNRLGDFQAWGQDADLRIMMVLDQFNVGGTETHILTTVRELMRRRIHVVVVGRKGEMMDAFAALGCPIYELNFVTDQYLENRAEEKNIVGQLKQIINIEGINLIHAHQIPSGHFAMMASEQLRIPVVFTVHGHYSSLEAEILKKSQSLICVSPSVYKNLPVKGVAAHLIPNGVDTVQFNERPFVQTDLRKELGISETAPLIMYAGRLSWEKADICRDMIEACRQLREEHFPDIHLLIVGEGRQSDSISELVNEVHEQTGEDFIHLLGNSFNMPRYYSISDTVVGTGRTAIEALASRRPVIAIGIKGFIGHVHPGNYEVTWSSWFGDHHADEMWSVPKIKQSLQQVLSLSDEEWEEQGWVSRNFVKGKFDIQKTTNALLEVYKDVLRRQFMADEVNG